jgi:hypothetical protein
MRADDDDTDDTMLTARCASCRTISVDIVLPLCCNLRLTTHLHTIHCVVHSEALDSLEQDLHHVLAPVVVVVVQHHLVNWGLLLAALSPAAQGLEHVRTTTHTGRSAAVDASVKQATTCP